MEEEEVARSAATMPASQLESLLSPAPTSEVPPTVSELLAQEASPLPNRRRPKVPHRERGVHVGELDESGRRQTGVKSLSVLERDGMPVLKDEGQGESRSQEVQILSLIRQVGCTHCQQVH